MPRAAATLPKKPLKIMLLSAHLPPILAGRVLYLADVRLFGSIIKG
jgi:hypothetical protein